MATLSDPTNFGNKPGDGPLRPGGRSASGILTDTDLPSTRSPLSAAQIGATDLMRDLAGGTEAVRAAGQTYLPKAPGEKPGFYANRLARSVFFNAVERTVQGLTGLVFRKDPVLSDDPEGGVPEQIVEHWENIDLEGTHGDVFCRDLLADALLVGHAAILVDYPNTGGNQRRDQEVAGNIRPYWVPIKKEDIMSWRSVQEGGASVLTQLVLREKTWVPDGRFGEREQTRYRVFYREMGRVWYELLEVTKNNEVTRVEEGDYPTQTLIPVAEIKTSGSKSLFNSKPPLLDLGYLNVAHYQQWSDYAYAMFKSNVPFLFGKGIEEAKDPKTGEKLESIVIGPNTSFLTSGPNADLKYVSHDGAALGSSKQALDDLKADMGTLGLAMLAPQKRTAETAEAKRLDKSTSDSALAVAARAEQDAVENALQFHANYLRLESGGSVTINRDFEGLLMEAPVMAAFAQLVNAGFPARLVLEALKQGGRIADDADLDELEMLWLMGSELNRQIPPPEEEVPPEAIVEGNPYHVIRRGSRYCVERSDTGERMKCYATKKEALDYFRALEANVEDA